MDIEEGPCETLAIVEVTKNNDKNEFRTVKTDSANKDTIIIPKMI